MVITVEQIVAGLTFILSAIALYSSLRKQEKEESNIDADTIQKLYATINEQEERYKKYKDEAECKYEALRKEFDEHKKAMAAQLAYFASENDRLRKWAHKLVKQLEDAQIIPAKFE